mgnify:CR=1 FL=1
MKPSHIPGVLRRSIAWRLAAVSVLSMLLVLGSALSIEAWQLWQLGRDQGQARLQAAARERPQAPPAFTPA